MGKLVSVHAYKPASTTAHLHPAPTSPTSADSYRKHFQHTRPPASRPRSHPRPRTHTRAHILRSHQAVAFNDTQPSKWQCAFASASASDCSRTRTRPVTLPSVSSSSLNARAPSDVMDGGGGGRRAGGGGAIVGFGGRCGGAHPRCQPRLSPPPAASVARPTSRLQHSSRRARGVDGRRRDAPPYLRRSLPSQDVAGIEVDGLRQVPDALVPQDMVVALLA
jgi:hypothetical protein